MTFSTSSIAKRPRHLSAGDVWFSLIAILVAVSLPLQLYAKPLSGAPVAIIVALLAAVCVARKPILDGYLLGFMTIGTIYIVLSFGDFLLRSWSPEREPSYILRQAHYVYLVPVLIIGFRTFFASLPRSRVPFFKIGAVLIMLSWPAYIYVTRTSYVGAQVSPYGFDNYAMFFYIFAIIVLYPHRWLFAVAFLLLGIFTEAAQNLIACGLLVAIRLAPRSRLAIPAIAALPFAPLIFLPFWASVYQFDANFGVRLLFLGDALEALSDTVGLGVGFGTWGIRNFYAYVSGGFFKFTTPDQNIYTISVHNSLFGLMMRMGLLIGVMYTALIVKLTFAANKLAKEEYKFAACIAIPLFSALWANVAIESPTYSVGVAFCVALLDRIVRSGEFRNYLMGIRFFGPARAFERSEA